MSERGLRKTRVGIVVSDKMDKSVVVEVRRRVQHPLYKKFIQKRSRFVAHDEQNQCAIGDKVRIVETRPLSKSKRWRIRERLT
jgi:small subunit ribosomal protein S17